MSTINIHEDKFVSMQFITELTGLSDKWFYKLVHAYTANVVMMSAGFLLMSYQICGYILA